MKLLKKIFKLITIFVIVVLILFGVVIFSALYYVNNHYLVSKEFNSELKSNLGGIPLEFDKLSLSLFSLNIKRLGLKDQFRSLSVDNCKISWDVPMVINASKLKPFKLYCTIENLSCAANIPEKLKALLPVQSINCSFEVDPSKTSMISAIEGKVYKEGHFKLDFQGDESGVNGTLNFKKVNMEEVLKNSEFKNSDKLKVIGQLSGDFLFKAEPKESILTINGISSSSDFIICPDLAALPAEFAVLTTFVKEVKVKKIIIKDLIVDNGVLKINPPIVIETDLTNINISGFSYMKQNKIDMEISFKMPSGIFDNPFYSFVGKKEMGIKISISGPMDNPKYDVSNY